MRKVLTAIFFLSLSFITQAQKVTVKSATTAEVNKLLHDSNKKRKIVYIINRNCSASADFTPLFEEFYLKNKDDFEFVVLAIEGLKRKKDLENFLFFEGYYFPVYIVSKGNLRNTIRELCKDCDETIMGYASFFILDENNKLVEQSNFNLSKTEKIEILNNYLNE